MDAWEEAIPWLEKATMASRYEAPQYPYVNLGRVYEHLGRFQTALTCYDKALALDPFYRAAIWAKFQLLGKMN
jgi:tetratricopeptide (TPR) repeat protein